MLYSLNEADPAADADITGESKSISSSTYLMYITMLLKYKSGLGQTGVDCMYISYTITSSSPA